MRSEEIMLEGYPFTLVAGIKMDRDRAGKPSEHNPAGRYYKYASTPLNPHGHKQFCKFRLDIIFGNEQFVRQPGVYAVHSTSITYLGRTRTTLIDRFNNGYGITFRWKINYLRS